MAKVTPNIASVLVAGVVKQRTALNPNMSPGKTSQYAGFNPEYAAGDVVKVMPGDHFSTRNGGSMKVFSNESKRPGTDALDQTFYAHIA